MEGSFGSLHARQNGRDGTDRGVIGPVLITLGVVCGVAGWLLLRRGGSDLRVGRLLAAAPRRTLEEAVAVAARGEEAYIRLPGRIGSDEEFPGEDGKPHVYRRRRLQHRESNEWRTFDDERLAVPFHLSDKGQRVMVDVDARGDGCL